jgi:predicted TIM-barrel fold metal-dependent hydrolase
MSPQQTLEPAIDPELPIIDTHHHLYDRISEAEARIAGGRRRYLIDELLQDMDSGHNIVATVYVDAAAMYRADGPPEFRVVGETEFANGQAAMSASGVYGSSRIAAGIVGTTDCRLGDRVRPVLEAHIAAGGGRFRGIRQTGAWDSDPAIFGGMFKIPSGLYLDSDFRRGFAHLAPLGLSFDAFVLSTQLQDVINLSRSFPNTRIVLDHVGGPVGVGRYRGRLGELFPTWKRDIEQLAQSPNVTVKLGGLGSFLGGFRSYGAQPPASSKTLAEEWRPYIETCIEAFRADRCMFESNYPVDCGSGSYGTIVNAFKRITAGCSSTERAAVFAGTAIDVYQLRLNQPVAA